jgi:hypothetical protein
MKTPIQSYPQRIEELKRVHQEQIAALGAEYAIASRLPDGAPLPYMIHFTDSDCPWLSYHVETLEDALGIVRAFPQPFDVSAVSDGCLSIAPVGRHRARYQGKPETWRVPQGIEVAQHGGRGFFTGTVAFWCASGGRDCIKVKIEVKQFPWKYRARMNCRYGAYGHVEQAEFIDSELRHLSPAARVKYNGGSPDAFDIRYFFSGADRLAEVVAAAGK